MGSSGDTSLAQSTAQQTSQLHHRQHPVYDASTPEYRSNEELARTVAGGATGSRPQNAGMGSDSDSNGAPRRPYATAEHDSGDSGESEELLPSRADDGDRAASDSRVGGAQLDAGTGSLYDNDQYAVSSQSHFGHKDEVSAKAALQPTDLDGYDAPSHINGNGTRADRSSKRKAKGKGKGRRDKDKHRTKQFAKEMAFVTVPSILLSMVGSVLAGEVLAKLKTWPVFLRVEELFILVPILLNLKGNLEMNLAARFSTSANIGELDLRQTRKSLVMGNMALLQVQALLVSLLAGIVAFILGLMSRTGLADSPSTLTGHDLSAYGVERGGYFECVMVLCASMIAASASSAVVGAFMCSLVVMSRFLKINPDNLATPLAASLGDLLALTILAIVARAGAEIMGTLWSTFILIGLLGFVAANVWFTLRNAYVQELIWAGWIPLLLALAVSSGTGLVLQAYVNEFRGFGLIAQVVTGVAGNVAAIFVSRISTALHGAKEERYLLTASTLFCISTPILIAFLAFIGLTGQVNIGFAFATSYTLLSLAIMAVSLVIAYYLTFWLWSRDYDPDINALPLLSAAIDLVGQILLVGAFFLAKAFHGDVELPTPVITPSGEVITNATRDAVAEVLRLLS